jgi:protoporphyrinogen oxidase
MPAIEQRIIPTPVVIIGAGPAGLTAGYLLAKAERPVVVLEANPTEVGGISRTVRHKGFGFDIGGHRFFSKSKEVEDLWTELLPHDMLVRPRSSRIYYRGKFFAYPLKAGEALGKLGLIEAMRCVASYCWARLRPVRNPRNFEDWVTNQFGARLFGIFFKTYTEKVWGMSTRDISADWAAQRIKGLSLSKAVWASLGWRKNRGSASGDGNVIKTLINCFRYPRKGPGMLWEAAAARIGALGGEVKMGRSAIGLHYDSSSGQRRWRVTVRCSGDDEETYESAEVISSAPLRELVTAITPPMSEVAREAAARLRYRDFLTVALILRDRKIFDDNWIYIHDPSVKVGRVQNFKSWSPELIPDPTLTCYGLEYFCFEGDGLWASDDASLVQLATEEIVKIGLAHPEDVIEGCVVRQPKAYPVYDDGYRDAVAIIRRELETSYPGLHLVGRNGMHKYNNQDHAMMTAMLCVRNILAGERRYDLWQVNEDAEYHEAVSIGDQSEFGLRAVPAKVSSKTTFDA